MGKEFMITLVGLRYQDLGTGLFLIGLGGRLGRRPDTKSFKEIASSAFVVHNPTMSACIVTCILGTDYTCIDCMRV